MRVVHVYYEPLRAGLFRHVVQLTLASRERGHDVLVVGPPGDEDTLAAALGGRARVHACPMRPYLNVTGTVRLTWLLRQLRPDVVHVHGQHAGLWGRVAARLAGVAAVVYTPHTVNIRRSALGLPYRHLERRLSRWTDAIISVSRAGAATLRVWGVQPRQGVVVVPNGVEPCPAAFERAAARQLLGVPDDALVVMQVGRLSPQKAPDVLLQAFSELAARLPRTQLIFVGEGPLRGSLAARTMALGLADRVRMVGQSPDARAVLPGADVCVLASRWEGLPYVALEAMSCGVPLVVTGVGGNPEVVRDGVNGLVVPPNDAVALAGAIVRLLDDVEERVAMGEAGRRCVSAGFRVDDMARATEAVYVRALDVDEA